MSRNLPVKGVANLDKFLSALPKNMQKAAFRQGLTAAAAVIRDEARSRAPKASGMMAKAIKTGSARQNQDGTFSVRVALYSQKEGGNNHAFLGLFHEYGVSPHFITGGDSDKSARLLTRAGKSGVDVVARAGKRKGQTEVLSINGAYVSGAVHHPGHAAHPFMRPALDAKADEAIQAFAGKIRAYLEGKTGFAAPMDEAA